MVSWSHEASLVLVDAMPSQMYGVRTVLLSTDDAEGKVTDMLPKHVKCHEMKWNDPRYPDPNEEAKAAQKGKKKGFFGF